MAPRETVTTGHDMKSRNYIQRLTEGDESAFNDIYSSFRPGFISYARAALHLDFNDATDLFQEVCTLFLVNVRKGKLTGLADPQVGAYLYTTGRFINSNRIRKKGLPTVHGGPDVPDEAADCPKEEEQIWQVVRDVVKGIPDPCSTILELQYFQQKKHAEIAMVMGYESADSVKTMASRCRGKVKVLIRQKLRELGYE